MATAKQVVIVTKNRTKTKAKTQTQGQTTYKCPMCGATMKRNDRTP